MVETLIRLLVMAGQMVMGFILPFALAFVAIPLESLLHSGRTVVGHILELLLQVLATFLRILAVLSRQVGRAINSCYDLTVIPMLWVERRLNKRSYPNSEAKPEPGEISNEQTYVPNTTASAAVDNSGSMRPSPI